MYYIITQSPEQRSRLINHLSDRGICAVIHYVPLHSSPAGRRYGRAFGQLSVTEDLSMRLLRLPIYFDMTFDDVATVAAAVTEFFVKER
jgi:dTDP-4-amino-4,6-dideoxygalactose transaminase